MRPCLILSTNPYNSHFFLLLKVLRQIHITPLLIRFYPAIFRRHYLILGHASGGYDSVEAVFFAVEGKVDHSLRLHLLSIPFQKFLAVGKLE